MTATTTNTGWGLIAGNGRFPFLVLEGARSQGIDMVVADRAKLNSAAERRGHKTTRDELTICGTRFYLNSPSR